MSAMEDGTDYQRVLDSLRGALDPHGVLAPGRYIPKRTRAQASSR